MSAALVASVRRNLPVAVDLREAYGIDLPAVLAALTEAEALKIQLAESQATALALTRYAEFGAWAFEEFWHDAEPGDIDGGDAQESAIKSGLLRRRTEADADLPCCDYCQWELREMPMSACECLFPTTGLFAPPTGSDATLRAILERALREYDEGGDLPEIIVDRVLGGS